MKKVMLVSASVFALFVAAGVIAAPPTVTSHYPPEIAKQATDGFAALDASGITAGNIAAARMTNAMSTVTGTMITNTCVAADGKTNTYIFVPFGSRYILHSITTSP